MIHVLIGVPTSGRVESEFAYSLATMVASAPTIANYIPGEGFAMGLSMTRGSVIHSNREMLGQQILADKELTHLLFIDDDMAWTPMAFGLLLSRRLPIVCSNYVMKQRKTEFLAVSLDGKRRIPTTPQSIGLESINYSGFGLSLWAREVFETVPQPWFLPEWVPAANDGKGGYTTEDNPFYARCRAAGFKVWLDHDASKHVAHIGVNRYSWDQDEVKNG
jgi:hypothetical protein